MPSLNKSNKLFNNDPPVKQTADLSGSSQAKDHEPIIGFYDIM